MVRQTSIQSYNKIKDEGLLGRLQFEVYDALYHHGPLTQNELHQYYFKSTQPRNIQPRVSELVKFGVVACAGVRACRITDNQCMVWDVTEDLPFKSDKTKSKDQIISELRKELANLQAENAILRGKLDFFKKKGG